jgi:alpha-beta hydrolase superfamily lysophospholipase
VFDLRTSEEDEKKQSVLQSLSDLGFRAYALDLRGECTVLWWLC